MFMKIIPHQVGAVFFCQAHSQLGVLQRVTAYKKSFLTLFLTASDKAG